MNAFDHVMMERKVLNAVQWAFSVLALATYSNITIMAGDREIRKRLRGPVDRLQHRANLYTVVLEVETKFEFVIFFTFFYFFTSSYG